LLFQRLTLICPFTYNYEIRGKTGPEKNSETTEKIIILAFLVDLSHAITLPLQWQWFKWFLDELILYSLKQQVSVRRKRVLGLLDSIAGKFPLLVDSHSDKWTMLISNWFVLSLSFNRLNYNQLNYTYYWMALLISY
jgi:hypothetical protein